MGNLETREAISGTCPERLGERSTHHTRKTAVTVRLDDEPVRPAWGKAGPPRAPFKVGQTIGSPRADFHHGPSLALDKLNKAGDTDAV